MVNPESDVNSNATRQPVRRNRLASFGRWQVMLVAAVVIIIACISMPAIQRFRALRYLEAHGCQYEFTESNRWLTDWFGDAANGFREVHAIAMDPVSVSDETLLHLSRFDELRILIWRQSGNPIAITHRGVESLQRLEQLEELILKGPGFSDEFLTDWMSAHPPLREVDLCLVDVSRETLVELTQIPTLSRLCITHGTLTDELFEDLSPAIALTELLVPGTQVGDACAEWASMTPSISSLSMGATLISDEGLAHLGNLQHLDALNLAACPGISPEGIQNLECLTELTHLSISSSTVTPVSVESFQLLPRLREIAVVGAIADSELQDTLERQWELIQR
jgi:hypothetical protein